MPINKRLKRELKKNFAKYFFIGLVLFMGITTISAFFAATDGIMGTIESEQDNCNVVIGWMDIEEIQNVTIYPEFIKTEIHNLNGEIKHFISK